MFKAEDEQERQLTAQHLYACADHQFKHRDYSQALQLAQRCCAVDPQHIAAWYCQLRRLRQQKAWTAMTAVFNRIQMLDSQYMGALEQQGSALLEQGDFLTALPLFERLLAIDATHLKAIYYKICCLLQQRESAAVVQFFAHYGPTVTFTQLLAILPSAMG